MYRRIRAVTQWVVNVSFACYGVACAAPSVSRVPPASCAEVAHISPSLPPEDPTLEALVLADRKALAGCRDNPGEKIARACSVSLSLATCAPAHPNEIGCCITACGIRIGEMRSAIVENEAQECAARVRLSPAPVNPVCDLRLPTLSPIRREQVESPCMERCRELLSK